MDDGEESEDLPEIEAEQKVVLPTHIYINFWYDRSFFNKILFVYYKSSRILFVSVWYYFLPFIALMSSYIVPRLMSGAPTE